MTIELTFAQSCDISHKWAWLKESVSVKKTQILIYKKLKNIKRQLIFEGFTIIDYPFMIILIFCDFGAPHVRQHIERIKRAVKISISDSEREHSTCNN